MNISYYSEFHIMTILTINSGSSSIKFQVIDMTDKKPLCKGLVERIGVDGAFHYEPLGEEKISRQVPIPDHVRGIQLILEAVVDKETGVLADLSAIGAVGHRMVHGGESITKSELLTPEVVGVVEENIKLAPLHNPPTLMGFRATQKLLPDVPQVGVFDTAFYSQMPKHAYTYALEYKYYDEYGIRRFGFHGTSHQYVSMRAAEMLGKPVEEVNLVTCHIGNGVSITAVKNGTAVDTSLGFGTMCGVPMGTRSGDVDPDAILYMIDNIGLSPAEVRDIIYKRSGLKGISGLTNDMRDLIEAAGSGNERARLALDIFAHMARKQIAALATNLGGSLDAVVFTAGIGENSITTREEICEGLEVIGVNLDSLKNQIRAEEKEVSQDGSPVKVLVVPTNEELMIALETERISGSANRK